MSRLGLGFMLRRMTTGNGLMGPTSDIRDGKTDVSSSLSIPGNNYSMNDKTIDRIPVVQ